MSHCILKGSKFIEDCRRIKGRNEFDNEETQNPGLANPPQFAILISTYNFKATHIVGFIWLKIATGNKYLSHFYRQVSWIVKVTKWSLCWAIGSEFSISNRAQNINIRLLPSSKVYLWFWELAKQGREGKKSWEILIVNIQMSGKHQQKRSSYAYLFD